MSKVAEFKSSFPQKWRSHGYDSKATEGFTFQTLNTGSTKSSSYLTDTFCSRGQQQASDKRASVNILIFPLVLLGAVGFPTDGCPCVPLKGPKRTFLGDQDKQLRRTAGCGNPLCCKNPQKVFSTVSWSSTRRVRDNISFKRLGLIKTLGDMFYLYS